MGFAESMNAVMRVNKSLRKSLHRRDEHFNMKDTVIKRRKNIKYNFPKASKSLLTSIRQTAKEDKQKDIIKKVFILLIAIMLTLAIAGFLVIAYQN